MPVLPAFVPVTASKIKNNSFSNFLRTHFLDILGIFSVCNRPLAEFNITYTNPRILDCQLLLLVRVAIFIPTLRLYNQLLCCMTLKVISVLLLTDRGHKDDHASNHTQNT